MPESRDNPPGEAAPPWQFSGQRGRSVAARAVNWPFMALVFVPAVAVTAASALSHMWFPAPHIEGRIAAVAFAIAALSALAGLFETARDLPPRFCLGLFQAAVAVLLTSYAVRLNGGQRYAAAAAIVAVLAMSLLNLALRRKQT